MTPTRREFIATVGTGAMASAIASSSSMADEQKSARGAPRLRVRTVTAGLTLDSLGDLAAIDKTVALLRRARRRFEDAGYEVQTLRIATQPIIAAMDPAARDRALPALIALDKAVQSDQIFLSLGPLLVDDRADATLAAWCAELVQRTATLMFSTSVASAEGGVHRKTCATAAGVMLALAKALPGGVANFRFAAAANIPAGTPFFPVGFHEGAASIAIGLETPGLVEEAFTGAHDPLEGEQRLRNLFNHELGAVERIGLELAAKEGVRYLGIDPSPAPAMDSSIGAAIEALTHVPFGSASTLGACAAITSALKTLSVKTCGYAGLMLPVLEEPVLAARAVEGRYGIEELLLYSSVCGTGLDVVPIPGDCTADTVARIVGDVASLAVKLRKPLSARLFPVPGKRAGELVRFDNPRLTETSVFAVDAGR
ncbi:MAG TPA: DUF711 family protein [Steroidobacteraceae bacterium]|nr:DUF711 family protein [Steroidobacteraceae bacterium]